MPEPQPVIVSLPGKPCRRAAVLAELVAGDRLLTLAGTAGGVVVRSRGNNRTLMDHCEELVRQGRLRKWRVPGATHFVTTGH